MDYTAWFPCSNCWNVSFDGIAQRALTGSATNHCRHRGLGFVIHAEAGKPRRWAISRMSAEQVQERQRTVVQALHKQHGLRPIK